MNRITLIVFFLGFIATSAFGQGKPHMSKDGLIVYYRAGMPTYNDSSCDLEVQRKYGFKYGQRAGCVVNNKILRQVKTNNRKADRLMKRTHGKNWRGRFENEVADCEKRNK